jgi:hypothetical protein
MCQLQLACPFKLFMFKLLLEGKGGSLGTLPAEALRSLIEGIFCLAE